MSKENELLRKLSDMVKETKAGRIFWDVDCHTTEYNPPEEKPVVVEGDGKDWTVDECYISYHCEYKGAEFLMITYEMIHSREDKQKTTNLVFLPPLGIRYFDLHALLPYAVETDQMLAYHIRMLWLAILELQKKDPDAVNIDASERKLTIDDDN